MLIRLLLQASLDLSQIAASAAELDQLVLQMRRSWLAVHRLRPVSRVQCIQVALDAVVDLLHALLKLVGREVLVAIVDRLELAAVDGNDGLGKQLELAAHRQRSACRHCGCPCRCHAESRQWS